MSSTAPPSNKNHAQLYKLVVYSPEQHAIRKDDIDDDARRVVIRLQRAGYKAYIVGGGVRDILLGKRPKDFDISTDATPKEIKALFGTVA